MDTINTSRHAISDAQPILPYPVYPDINHPNTTAQKIIPPKSLKAFTISFFFC
jgi:hypothetical protein